MTASLDVEFESFDELLARTGRRAEVERIPTLLRMHDAERDLGQLGDLLSDLYSVGPRARVTSG